MRATLIYEENGGLLESEELSPAGQKLPGRAGNPLRAEATDAALSYHYLIWYDGAAWMVAHAGKQGATYLNDKPLTQAQRLGNRDTIVCNRARVALKYVASTDLESDPSAVETRRDVRTLEQQISLLTAQRELLEQQLQVKNRELERQRSLVREMSPAMQLTAANEQIAHLKEERATERAEFQKKFEELRRVSESQKLRLVEVQTRCHEALKLQHEAQAELRQAWEKITQAEAAHVREAHRATHLTDLVNQLQRDLRSVNETLRMRVIDVAVFAQGRANTSLCLKRWIELLSGEGREGAAVSSLVGAGASAVVHQMQQFLRHIESGPYSEPDNLNHLLGLQPVVAEQLNQALGGIAQSIDQAAAVLTACAPSNECKSCAGAREVLTAAQEQGRRAQVLLGLALRPARGESE